MPSNESADIAKAWVALQYAAKKSGLSDYDEIVLMASKLYKIVNNFPDQALQIIEDISNIDNSEFILSNLGAGPIEDLLAEHGPLVIKNIINVAAKNENFKSAIKYVWRNSISSEVWNEVLILQGRIKKDWPQKVRLSKARNKRH